MTDETTDQAQEQSVMDRLASKFGRQSDPPEGQAGTQPAEGAETQGLEEIEWEGEKFQLPSKLKDALMKNADYTKKTMELSEQRKAVDHSRELLKRAEMEKHFAQSVAGENQELAVIEAYLSQAMKQDWATMPTDKLMRTRLEIDQVRDRKELLKQSLVQKRGEFDQQIGEHIKVMRDKAREMAAKSITGYSEETEKSVRSWASKDYSEAQLDNILMDAASFKHLWQSMQYEKVAANAGKAATAAEKVVRPGPATERMPADKVSELNYRKAMKSARTSSEKASLMESRLADRFGGSRR